jgi:hypothetical protein
LDQVRSRLGTNVGIFVPGHIPTRYKCEDDTFVPVGATNRYKCECLTFVPGGLEEAPRRPCEGGIAFVPRAKISSTNQKSGQGQMYDSLVVVMWIACMLRDDLMDDNVGAECGPDTNQ